MMSEECKVQSKVFPVAWFGVCKLRYAQQPAPRRPLITHHSSLLTALPSLLTVQ